MYLPAMHDELVLHFKLISQAAFLFLPRSGKLYPILSPEVLLHKQMSIIIILKKKKELRLHTSKLKEQGSWLPISAW